MKNVMGLILTDGFEENLGVLTERRDIAALPFGGRYRVIDFILSNMVNSGIGNVAVTTKKNFSSLMDHLGSGKHWDLSRKNGGLKIIPPNTKGEKLIRPDGDITAVYDSLDYLKSSKEEYVLLAEGFTILSQDYTDMFKFHKKMKADITLSYFEDEMVGNPDYKTSNIIEVSDGVVTDYYVNPQNPKTKNSSIRQLIIKRNLLIDLVAEAYAKGGGSMGYDIIIKNINKLKVCAYKFDGYIGVINDIKSYFKCNLDILDKSIRDEIFNPARPIYTKVRDGAPARYGDTALLCNSIVADGCIIEGEIENCILFRGVSISRDSRIENCVIMQDSIVLDGCNLENVIIDKNATIRSNINLVGQISYPVIVKKDAVV